MFKKFSNLCQNKQFCYFRVENVKKCKHVNTSGFEGRLFRLFFPLFFFGDCFSLLDLVSIKLFDGKICIVVV